MTLSAVPTPRCALAETLADVCRASRHDQYPGWIRPVVEHQPMSYAVGGDAGLALGSPVLAPLIGTLLWSTGIAAACAPPLFIGYRKASTR
jgi:ABC-2 type transport system permease protein